MKKRSKSLPSVLLACALLSTMPFATVAQAADTSVTATAFSKDDAVKKARDVANLPEATWKLTSVLQRSGSDVYDNFNRPTWVLQFSSTDKNTYDGASVIIDSSNGQLLGLNHYQKGVPPKKGTLNRDDAQKVAEAFLQANAPEQFKQTERNDSMSAIMRGPYDGVFNFTYERKLNGAYVVGDQILLSIGSDGSVQNYMLHWTDAQFPALDGKIDGDSAQKTYADSLKLQLSYQEVYQSKLTEKLLYKAAYAPSYSPMKYYTQSPVSYPIIDAKSGKLLTPSGQETTSVNAPDPVPLVKDGPTEPKLLSTPLTQEDAEKMIKSLGILPDNVKLLSSSYTENSVNKMWNFEYQDPNTTSLPPAEHYSFSINALTGEMNNYYSYSNKGSNGGGTVTYTNDQLKTKAIDLVKAMFKDRTGALLQPNVVNDTVNDPNNTMRNFTFGMLKNGVLTNDGVTVTFDAATGNLQNVMGFMMNSDSSQVTYPTPDNLFSADKAKAVYLQNRPLRLSYLFPVTDTGRSNTPVLVYTPIQSWNGGAGVDAKTGEWFNADNGPQQKPPVMPTDIKGHWAEKSLTHYAELGLLELVDGKANPDQKLTRAQVVRLLVDARGGGFAGDGDPTFADVSKDYKYYGQIESAVRQGWIAVDSKFRPDDTITREEVAAILARVEGFKALSTQKEIFHVSYADSNSISDWAYGSVAINYGLGVMRGANNKFEPKSDITLAQMVTVLDKLGNLPNSPIFYK